jgi:hypothetical protein
MNAHGSSTHAKRRQGKDASLKTRPAKETDEIRPEYDFSKMELVRGKYFHRYWEGRSIIRLSPDVAAVFRDEESVNSALRTLIKIAKAQPRRTSSEKLR